jgi:hypothetical protein
MNCDTRKIPAVSAPTTSGISPHQEFTHPSFVHVA